MSIARQLFHEFRPFFRALEEPFGYGGRPYRVARYTSPFDHPFFRDVESFRPSVGLTEEGNAYVVETAIPGVKKENLDIRIGDNGQSVTIEGRVLSRLSNGENRSEVKTDATTAEGASAGEAPFAAIITADTSSNVEADATVKSAESGAVNESGPSKELSESSSVFSRTVWLPHRADESKVSAKLEDGILTLRIPKAEDKQSVKISIE